MTSRSWTLEEVRGLVEPQLVPAAVVRGAHIVAVNRALCQVLGIAPVELEGRPWSHWILGDGPERASGSRSKAFPIVVRGQGARLHPFLAHVERLPTVDGDTWGVSTLIELPVRAGPRDVVDVLTSVSTALLSAHSVHEAREVALRELRGSAIGARFIDPGPAGGGEEVQRAIATGRPVFAGVDPEERTRVWIPFLGPAGQEILLLESEAISAAHAPSFALFARLLSAAMTNVRLISELERLGAESLRQLTDTRLLLDLARTTSGTLELGAILDAACDFLVRLLDVSNCFILLYDASTRELRGAAASAAHREFFRGVAIPLDGPGVASTAARERRPISVEDTGTQLDGREGRRDLVEHFQEQALLAMPLVTRDELLGAVVFDDVRAPRSFPPQLIELAQASIAQLALSVSNARLFDSLRRSYAELDATRAEMVKRERLAALGELSAIVAHEVRNPLGVIFNAVSSLRRLSGRALPSQSQADAQMLLDIVAEESDRLNRIVGDLLDFARPRGLTLQPEDVERLIHEAIDVVRADAGTTDRIRFLVEVVPGLPRVPLDRHLLRQALVNVALNAAQAMPQGGTATVRAFAEPPGRLLCIEVQDEGPGIPPELLARVFEPFFTTRARGSGLGLAVVKRIVEDHRGEVLVRSEPGRGTTFSFRLPLPPSQC